MFLIILGFNRYVLDSSWFLFIYLFIYCCLQKMNRVQSCRVLGCCYFFLIFNSQESALGHERFILSRDRVLPVFRRQQNV